MASVFAPERFAALTADGEAAGYITVADNEGFYPGAVAWIRDNNSDPLECIITELVGTTKIGLRNKRTGSYGGRTDMSGYTIAQNATISMEGQVVAVDEPFTPKWRA